MQRQIIVELLGRGSNAAKQSLFCFVCQSEYCVGIQEDACFSESLHDAQISTLYLNSQSEEELSEQQFFSEIENPFFSFPGSY